MIDRVTITGADDATDPRHLLELSQEFPFVEWGVLLSRNNNRERFPSHAWIERLLDLEANNDCIKTAGHLCGSWVRELIKGVPSYFDEHRHPLRRLQLNYGWDQGGDFLPILPRGTQYIIQLGDEYREDKIQFVRQGLAAGHDLSVLFDRSGGRGELPTEWPQAIPGVYCGYAGGLGPDTLEAQLPLIEKAANGQAVWIDMENNVRTKFRFDLTKVRQALNICRPHVRS